MIAPPSPEAQQLQKVQKEIQEMKRKVHAGLERDAGLAEAKLVRETVRKEESLHPQTIELLRKETTFGDLLEHVIADEQAQKKKRVK